ncbi:MAG TPA: cytochrome c oxidase subunit 3 [Gaiellaceae bacterium]|jgi:cytochrome c oxidase subunit 3
MTDIVVDRRARERFPLGWWGMAMLVATESALFGMMIGSYFYLRFKNAHWPPAGIPEPKLLIPLILLCVLLTTSFPMFMAARSATPKLWLLLALIVQSGYFAMEVHEYAGNLADFTPQDHAYGSIYYTLLGADHGHVAIGLLLNAWILWKLLFGMTEYRRKALRAIAFYWHAVNVLTLVVTLTVLSPAFA